MSVVSTNKARCRDCNRCVRTCPVKAIRVHDGQAQVVAERCIACGACVRACPQQAKTVRDDLDSVRALIASGQRVAVSLAPSYPARWRDWQCRRLPAALRQLGFDHVAETAIGARRVAEAAANLIGEAPQRRHIHGACPAVVAYLERYHHHQVDDLLPLCSPMIAHGRMIRAAGLADRVVFIGPCVAKKAEAAWPGNAGVIDAVLGFDELARWLEEDGIDLARLEESAFDTPVAGPERRYPLLGGALGTAGTHHDPLDALVVTASGPEEIAAVLIDDDDTAPQAAVVEPLFCSQGCINGPLVGGDMDLPRRRRAILDHAALPPSPGATAITLPPVDLATTFHPDPQEIGQGYDEQAIATVLAATGKAEANDRLDCGACGYDSCRDKAIAVLQGLAEADMCIPHMRRLAERRSDRILSTLPSGIVICDADLRIVDMNPALCRMFHCDSSLLGRPIERLLDPAPFERALADGGAPLADDVSYDAHRLTCRRLVYRIDEDRQVVGIFIDIGEERRQRDSHRRLRQEAVLQAQELLSQQTRMAQEIARRLGEHAAQGEALLDGLLHLAEPDNRTEPPGSTTSRRQSWRTT